MIDFDDIPDNSEFNMMFKKKFKEAIDNDEERFDFCIDEKGHCYETPDWVKNKHVKEIKDVKQTSRHPLRRT